MILESQTVRAETLNMKRNKTPTRPRYSVFFLQISQTKRLERFLSKAKTIFMPKELVCKEKLRKLCQSWLQENTRDRQNVMTLYLKLGKMKDKEELISILMVPRTVGRSKVV